MTIRTSPGLRKSTLAAALLAATVMAGCTATPHSPDGADQARSKLTVLQRDATLSTLAPVALRRAEAAVLLAELPELGTLNRQQIAALAGVS